MGTYTTPTFNQKMLNFRPNFPVDRGSQLFPQEGVQDLGTGKKKSHKNQKKLLHNQNFESPKI